MKTINERGFAGYADFTDTYGGRTRVFESSADPLDKVWVSIDSQLDVTVQINGEVGTLSDGKTTYPIHRHLYLLKSGVAALTPVNARETGIEQSCKTIKASASGHLSREQAKVLRDALDEFLKDQDARDKAGEV